MSISVPIISRTVGGNNDVSQVFIENNLIEYRPIKTLPFRYDVPLYGIRGASFRYYEQITDAISTNFNNVKDVTFLFSGNNYSFSGDCVMVHDLYRIPFSLYNDVLNNVSGSSLNEALDTALINPYVQFSEFATAFTNGITGLFSAHTLSFPAKVKPTGDYTQDLFSDKDQYFLNTRFLFQKEIDQTLGEIQTYTGESSSPTTLYVVPTGLTMQVDSGGQTPHSITGGTFAGKLIRGANFTYFTVPNKPNINIVNGQPSVFGEVDTLSPIFNFNNVEDGDYYKLQVSYNVDDVNFTGATIFNINSQPGNPDFIRSYSTTLSPEQNFLYRIGNTKEIINIFGIKQNITNWSEPSSARTSNNGTFTLSGSCYSGFVSPSNLMAGVQLTVTIGNSQSAVDLGSDSINNSELLSEVLTPVGGSIGGTINATYSTSSPFTSSDGFYTFSRINGGMYTITAKCVDQLSIYFGQTISKTILLNQASSVDFVFQIVWGNTNILMSDTTVQFFN